MAGRRLAASDAGGRDADLVLLRGRVHTLADAGPPAEGLAVRDGRIVAVGDADAIRAWVGPRTEKINLAGRTVLPGFNDAHNHLLWAGLNAIRPALDGAHSIADVLRIVGEVARQRQPGEWIVSAPAWHIHQLAERRHPTREELDRVAPENPVFLAGMVHDACANSLALRVCGIDASTPDPPGGSIER